MKNIRIGNTMRPLFESNKVFMNLVRFAHFTSTAAVAKRLWRARDFADYTDYSNHLEDDVKSVGFNSLQLVGVNRASP